MGDSGTGLACTAGWAGERSLSLSLGGICSERPREWKSMRRGVTGSGGTRSDSELSSLAVRRAASRISGDGESLRPGVPPPSDRDRVLDMGEFWR